MAILLISLAQAQGGGLSAWELAWQAGPVVKFVILVLVALSIFTWAIIGLKFFQLRRARKESALFLKAFCKLTLRLKTPTTSPAIPLFLSASPRDPPKSPTPTIVTFPSVFFLDNSHSSI